ncbi:thiamine pyrophosphate-dependent dehydrogenase E1 component subunit alpha [Paracoccus sp. (in: a-proteobacteria)]|uniref:thiamine pyrophosphate-dependent dehydrogenase E1 component subunit alpha n=1 Tax=Paracoccus sp. TaxID=267 RepID=UPI002AFFFD3F|nr:thiamine pyrophosphate-dependent dehydrogenase E1 component subunit alpha [Paracoccus sp. (in: a-proteobacteria)]
MTSIDKTTASRLFRLMCEIRAFEQVAARRYSNGDLPGFIHLSLGQEACAAGACVVLGAEDFITSTHRGHGHCLAKGADARLMLAELFAKAQGYGKGRAGSMHIADVSSGVLGANGIVGQSMGLGIGAALSLQIRKVSGVVIAFFGEGASGTGIAHETMNMAAIWKLPIVFFCEANRFAELSPFSTHVSVPNIASRASAYGFPGVTVNGEDVAAVYLTVKAAVERARAGEGPTLIEAKTFRWHGHYEGDPQVYKTAEEKADGQSFDPIARMRERASELGGLTQGELDKIETEANAMIAEAEAWAEGLQGPAPATMTEDVYAEADNG